MTLRFASGFAPAQPLVTALVMCAALSGCVTPDNGTTKDPVIQDDTKPDAGPETGPSDTEDAGSGGTDPGAGSAYVTGAPQFAMRLGDPPIYPSDDVAGGDDVEAEDEGGDELEESADQGGEAASPVPIPAVEGDAGVAPSDAMAERIVARATDFAWAGDVLFALSPYDGLAALDLSDPNALRILGSSPSLGSPAEMVQVNDSLLVIERDSTSEADEHGGEQEAPTVSLEAFDVSDPTKLAVSASESIPGVFVASRRVGDVLYLVTSDDCSYGVSEGRVLVTSFDLTAAPKLAQIDQLELSTGEYSVCDGPVAVSAQRIYIARTYGGEGAARSQVRVVDISEPGGELVEGATLDVEGNIGQFDEFGGVLRLFAQHEDAEGLVASQLSTFSFTDAGEAVLEAELTIQVPEPQWLDLKFDGERAFVLYHEDSGQLLTFDLSDPAAPKQVGHLDDLDGVVSLKPQGERLYVASIGSENNQAVTVLRTIDVSTLKAPALLSQVQFAGTPEGSNHPHIDVQLDAGLIVAWDSIDQSDYSTCSYPDVIQLIALEGDSLELRGTVSAMGPINRALLRSQRLVTLGEHGVETFDVSELDAPKSTDQFMFERWISGVVPVGDSLLRLGRGGDVDATPIERADERQGTVELPLASVDQACTLGSWGEARAFGDVVYLPRFGDVNRLSLSILVVDAKDPQHPELVTELNPRLPRIEGANSDDQYFSNVHLTNNALLVERVHFVHEVEMHTSISYEVFTLEDPLNPKSVASIDVPDAMANAGWGAGGDFRSSNVSIAGDMLVGWHFVPLPGDPLRGRYYLDRLDVTEPKHPEFLEPLNVPGLVVHYEPKSETVITLSVDWTELEVDEEEGEACWQLWSSRDPTVSGVTDVSGQSHCARGERELHQLSVHGDEATLGRSVPADDGDWAFAATRDLDGVILLQQFTWEASETDASYRTVDHRLVALDLELATKSVTELPWDYVVSNGNVNGRRWVREADGQVFVFDAGDPEAPSLREVEVETEFCTMLQISGDRLYCGRSDGTVEVVALE